VLFILGPSLDPKLKRLLGVFLLRGNPVINSPDILKSPTLNYDVIRANFPLSRLVISCYLNATDPDLKKRAFELETESKPMGLFYRTNKVKGLPACM